MKIMTKLSALFLVAALLLTAIPAWAQDTIDLPEPVETVETGSTIEGELSEETPIVAYTLTGSEGDIVSIKVEFDDFDGYLLLVNEDSAIIAENDDRTSIFTSALPAFELPADGTYRIGVSTYSYVRSDVEDEGGTFTLTVTLPEVETLAIGDTVEGEIPEGAAEALYFIEAEAGQLLTITLEAEDFDAQLYLDPAQGQDVSQVSNDDYGSGTNSQIGPTLIRESGRYIIAATSFFEDETGNFTLSVSDYAPETIEAGDTARGELDIDALDDFYAFTAEEGQTVSIRVEAVETIDLVLELYGPDGESLAYNDDSDDLNPAIEYEVEADGTYLVSVFPAGIFFDENDLGEYDITLTVE